VHHCQRVLIAVRMEFAASNAPIRRGPSWRPARRVFRRSAQVIMRLVQPVSLISFPVRRARTERGRASAAHARKVLAPVLPITTFAATLEASDYRTREFIARFEIPYLEADGLVLVDAGVGERVARRAFGDRFGDAVHHARGGHPTQRAATPTAKAGDEPPATPKDALDWENIEKVLRAAIAEYGGLLSYPLYRQWCFDGGRRPWSIRRILHALDVKTWTEALAYCGGRRGVTTPTDRAVALELIAAALADHHGNIRMRDYPGWARRRNARWLDPAKVARAAGFATWNEALAAAKAENPAPAETGERGSEMRHDVA
jgi:hypothetical protein